MKKPTFSIIMPVYNVEPYLRASIESIVAQTFKCYEIILVNDGSTDNSGSICDEFSKKYNSIEVVHQQNGGLSAARNTGIQRATGKYSYFFDSDDLLEYNALENWNRSFTEYKVNAILFDADSFTEEDVQTTLHRNKYRRKSSVAVIQSRKFVAESIANKSFFACAWAYVTETEIIRKLAFDEGYIHEDNIFFMELFVYSEINLLIDPYPYFKRRIRVNSIMTQDKTEKNAIGYQRTFDLLCCRLKKGGSDTSVILQYLRYLHPNLNSVYFRAYEHPFSLKIRYRLIKNLLRAFKYKFLTKKVVLFSIFPDSNYIKNKLKKI